MLISNVRHILFNAAVLISVVIGAAAPVYAQTGLLVSADPGLAAGTVVGDAVALVAWRSGPIGWVSGAEDVPSTLAGLREDGATAVVILALSSLEGPSSAGLLAFEDESAGVFLVGVQLTAAELQSAATLARAVERRGSYAVAELLESGRLDDAGDALHRLAGINVTASREPLDGFDTPRPVSVVRTETITERLPNNASDLFKEIPGLDIEGVGTNQTRPMIRGLGGQRVLLLQEGLRLNNSRRRLDSGEPPAIAGIFELDRVEIVRGATSVLYGSDAIGGVVNLIPRSAGAPRSSSNPDGWATRAALQYRYSTVDDQHRVSGTASGGVGRFGYQVGASYRQSDPYDAPSGSFGDLTLSSDTRVQDTGVEDYNLGARLRYDFSTDHSVFARVERYRAQDAGFGFVEPDDLGTEGPRIQLLWPDLQFDRVIAGYDGKDLGTFAADRVTLKAYLQSNERDFITNVFVPSGPGVTTERTNFTDIDTYGMRAEAQRLLGGRHLLTYGLDLYEDRSFNTDRSSTMIGSAPPIVSETPGLPNASLFSVGAFAQSAFVLGSRTDLTLGLRWQGVTSETKETEGLDEPLTSATDATFVGAANLIVRASEEVNLIGSIGRGFRSPNLIERFFSGDAPGGAGVWERNPDLDAETSLNVDVGTRVSTGTVYAEGFLFGNFLTNGIELRPTGEEIDGQAVFHNVNISSIDILGVELSLGVEVVPGFTAEVSYTHVDATNPDDPEDTVLKGYRDRVNARLRYAARDDRFWVEYHIRHSGRTDRIAPGVSPVGNEVPAFTVMDLRGGVRVFGRHRLGLSIENLANALYAEPINVAFFRPSPKRGIALSWTSEF